MKSFFKTIWEYIKGTAKTLLKQLAKIVLDNVKDIIHDEELMALALQAVKEAFNSGLKDKKAFEDAKKRFKALLKEAGKDVKTSSINLILETVYNGWKSLGYPND